MARRLSLVILLALVVLLVYGPAQAKGKERLKSEVQALLDQAAAGFMKRDIKAVLAISASDCLIQYRNGRTLPIAQWARGIGEEIAQWQSVKSVFVVKKAWRMAAAQAGAAYTERHEFTTAKDPGHKHAIAARFEAVLHKTEQGWRVRKFIEKSVKFYRDGKEIRPKAKQ